MSLFRAVRCTALAGVATAALVVGLAAPSAASTPTPPPTPPIPVGWPAVSSASQTAPVTVAAGVQAYSETYQTADGPEQTQVLDLDLRRGARLDTVESHDHVIDPSNELTTSMGDRTGAVAGINGDYFAIHASGAPLGGVVQDGRLLKSPRPDYQAQLSVRDDGTLRIGEIDFSGQLRDGRASTALTSVNTVDDAAAGGITEVTSDLGADASIPTATLVIGRRSGDTLRVTEIRSSVTSVPALAANQEALLGGGAGGTWLATNVRPGDRVSASASLSDRHVAALLSGATTLVRNGAVYTDPTGTPPSGRNPETMVGVSRDGRHAMLVVIDGRQPTLSIGVTPLEAAEYLVAHGMDSGILLDGGGSSTLAARLPQMASLAILNHPSDATGERPVADGLFVYRH